VSLVDGAYTDTHARTHSYTNKAIYVLTQTTQAEKIKLNKQVNLFSGCLTLKFQHFSEKLIIVSYF